MKKRKIHLIIYTVIFALLLGIPILAFNRIPGRISETENRYLATFPAVFDGSGHLNAAFKSGFETWLNDNLGFRSKFVELATYIKLKLLHQPTSNSVEIGKDGWYFYTMDHNIELATGEFTLTDEILADIAAKQQRINDWYVAHGIKYLLVLTSSKPSVYPEYIASGDYSIRDTHCDQLETYLEEHTTVNVVNCKSEVLKHKNEGKLYQKTDTHHTQLGAYYAYNAIAQKMENMGESIQNFSVTYSSMKRLGDLCNMMNAMNILGEETVPEAEWLSHATPVQEGATLENLTNLQQASMSRALGAGIYTNLEKDRGTVLIYGDSMWNPQFCLPQFLCESFQYVVSTGIQSVSDEVDRLIEPDIVIYGCNERGIASYLTLPVTIPELVSGLPELPQTDMITCEEYGEWIGYQGICLDTYNDKYLEGSTTIQVDLSASSVKLRISVMMLPSMIFISKWAMY